MKEITLALFFNQHLTYVGGEVGDLIIRNKLGGYCPKKEIIWKLCLGCTQLMQPTKLFLKLYAARAELGEFVEYDLDNEDEDWLEDFSKDRKLLTAEK